MAWVILIKYYKNKTTLIITTDHGRGDANKDQWKDHGEKVKDASEIWLAVMGPDTEATGEVKTSMQLYQRQVATTIASILGFEFKPKQQVMEPVETIMRKR